MEEYEIVLESPMGPRNGSLRFEEKNGEVTGTLILLGYENPVTGKCFGEHMLKLFHRLSTQISDLTCVSTLETDKNRIFGELNSGRSTMKRHGTKISQTKAENEINGEE